MYVEMLSYKQSFESYPFPSRYSFHASYCPTVPSRAAAPWTDYLVFDRFLYPTSITLSPLLIFYPA